MQIGISCKIPQKSIFVCILFVKTRLFSQQARRSWCKLVLHLTSPGGPSRVCMHLALPLLWVSQGFSDGYISPDAGFKLNLASRHLCVECGREPEGDNVSPLLSAPERLTSTYVSCRPSLSSFQFLQWPCSSLCPSSLGLVVASCNFLSLGCLTFHARFSPYPVTRVTNFLHYIPLFYILRDLLVS